MLRLLFTLIILGSLLYLLWEWSRRQNVSQTSTRPTRTSRWLRPKKNPREVWVQVYETAQVEDARILQARLQEEEVDCILYEQGKKDIHGNFLKGIGIAVPKAAAPHAQAVISRIPV